ELASGASGVAAGMLAPVAEAAFGEGALLDLNLDGAARWPDFAAELAAASAEDPGYRRCGTLLVARDRDAAEALARELEFRRSLALPVESLRPSEARRLEPALAPRIRAALHVHDDHAVDPRALTASLAAAIERAGGELHTGAEVAALELVDQRVCGLRLRDGGRVGVGDVVIAAGAWSSGLGGIPDDAQVPIRPVKGQILRLRDPTGASLLERVLRMDTAYVVPRGNGDYVLGATVEERGWDLSVTAGAVYELLREAEEVLPGVAELELVEARAGLRPGTPDNAPAIGPSRVVGLHWATGHYRHGVLLAPVTAELVVAGVAGEQLPELAAPFAPERFATGVVA
ncbi:MAG: glycine oxidase, partial [Solirubrobacteraceae bacterium]|nr:glycine oxidase [Solirubrobacteraceae bacterium]